MTEPSTSFGRAASAYDRGRPGYPAEVIAWLLDGVDGTVLDLGAGTGKLTSAILRSGRRVVAVDPDPLMLAQLEARVPGVPTHRGTAESIPLDSASVDAVLVGQAWHWMDPEAALPEIARVLRPGGVLGLVWNVRDHAQAWTERLGRIIGRATAETFVLRDSVRLDEPFGSLDRLEHDWSHGITAAELRAFVHSRSHYITAAPALQRDTDAALDALIAATPALASGERTPLAYTTYAYRAALPGGGAPSP